MHLVWDETEFFLWVRGRLTVLPTPPPHPDSIVQGFIMQMVAARLGITTRQDLAQHVRAEYHPATRVLLWIFVEIGILTCDMLEVIGGACALSALSAGAIPMWAGVLITAATAFACLGLETVGMRYLEFFLMLLIACMSAAFLYLFVDTDVDYAATLKGECAAIRGDRAPVGPWTEAESGLT